MTIVVDENIPRRTVRYLVAEGHIVVDVRGTPDEGADDDALWDIAQRHRALLVSTDKGFARRRAEDHFGILIIRLRRPNKRRIHDRIVMALTTFAPTDWRNRLVIVRDRAMSVWMGKRKA